MIFYCLAHTQAVWTLTKIPEYYPSVDASGASKNISLPVTPGYSGLYTISNTAGSSGGGCLSFGVSGTDLNPTRRMFGTSGNVNLCGGTSTSTVSSQAIFRLQLVSANSTSWRDPCWILFGDMNAEYEREAVCQSLPSCADSLSWWWQ